MTGRAFPRGLGQDFSGVVDAVGSKAKRFKVGDEVFGATGPKDSGAFAEALVTDEKTILRKPRSLSFEAAAAMPTVCSAAWVALIDQAKLRAGQSVFITSCLGGVGRAAAQFARMRGATIAGSCSASRRNEAIALGVQEVVDYRDFQAETFRGRFDVVFDTHGSLSLGECGAMLKRGGVAEHCVPTPQKMIWSLLSSRHQTVFSRMTPPFMDALVEAAEQGNLTPAIGRTVPLSEAIPAIVELEKTGSPRGKLVVVLRP